MAANEIVRGEIAVHAVTLTAGEVDTVTWQDEVQFAEVLTDGSADVYVATDGNPATVEGGNCYRVPAGEGLPVARRVDASGGKLSIISATAVQYSVTRVEPGEGLGAMV